MSDELLELFHPAVRPGSARRLPRRPRRRSRRGRRSRPAATRWSPRPPARARRSRRSSPRSTRWCAKASSAGSPTRRTSSTSRRSRRCRTTSSGTSRRRSRASAPSSPRSASPTSTIRTFVRTGDTPQAERASMRKRPPHIVVTTPESLYILLTSKSGREMLRTTRTVIVDEIHALAPNKRGAHLALSLERLAALAAPGLVRVGLSATQKPIEEIAPLPRRRRDRRRLRHRRYRPREAAATSRSSCRRRRSRRSCRATPGRRSTTASRRSRTSTARRSCSSTLADSPSVPRAISPSGSAPIRSLRTTAASPARSGSTPSSV